MKKSRTRLGLALLLCLLGTSVHAKEGFDDYVPPATIQECHEHIQLLLRVAELDEQIQDRMEQRIDVLKETIRIQEGTLQFCEETAQDKWRLERHLKECREGTQ